MSKKYPWIGQFEDLIVEFKSSGKGFVIEYSKIFNKSDDLYDWDEAKFTDITKSYREYGVGMGVDKFDGGELNDGNKYHREIIGLCGTKVTVDVYRVLDAFITNDPILDHLIKKALCAGSRGHKDKITDYQNILESAQKALELQKQKILIDNPVKSIYACNQNA